MPMNTPPGSAGRAVGSHFKFTLSAQSTRGRQRRYSATTSTSRDALHQLTPTPTGLPPPQQQQQHPSFFFSPQTPSPFKFSIPARKTRRVDPAQISRDKDIISMFSSFHSPLNGPSRPAMGGMIVDDVEGISRVDDIESPGPIDAEIDLMATDDLLERERRRALLFSLEDEQGQEEMMTSTRGNMNNKRPSSDCFDTQLVLDQRKKISHHTIDNYSNLPLPTSCGSAAPTRVSPRPLVTPRLATLESAAAAINSGRASQPLTAIRNRLAPQFQVAVSPPSQLALHTASQSRASFHLSEASATRTPLPVGPTRPISAPQSTSPSCPKRKRYRVTPGGYLDQLYTTVRQERSDHVLWHHEAHSRFADSSYLLANQQHLRSHHQPSGLAAPSLNHILFNLGSMPANLDQPCTVTLSRLVKRLSPTSVEAVVSCPPAMLDTFSQARLPREPTMPAVPNDGVPTNPRPSLSLDVRLDSTNEMTGNPRVQSTVAPSDIRIILAWDYVSWKEQSTMFEVLTQAVANQTAITVFPPYQWVLPATTAALGSSAEPRHLAQCSTSYLLATRFTIDTECNQRMADLG